MRIKNNHHVQGAIPAPFFTLLCMICVFCFLSFGRYGVSFLSYADPSISFRENITRVSLIKEIKNLPQNVKLLDEEKIFILFREPSLTRNEIDVVAWHYHGESCSLAIYFTKGQSVPDYVEYRTLDMNASVQEQFAQTDLMTKDQYCIKDVLEARGVDTPNDFAKRPMPSSLESPYRS